ncbi:MAG: hypothetical protein E7510_14810, partial [Ruminococcus sp.]|nr:hypothetical protein [Ruminococcus sp.]
MKNNVTSLKCVFLRIFLCKVNENINRNIITIINKKRVVSVFLSCLLCFSILDYGVMSEIEVKAAGYNVNAAVDYAKKYWNNYNPDYPNCNSIGGDCANFVSQCLYAGGLQQDSTWKVGSSAWQYCPDMVKYLGSKYKVIDYAKASDMKIGNPVFYWNSSKGRWSHAAICTGFNGSTPLVSAHNKNHIDYEWTLGGANYWGSDRRLTVLMEGDLSPINQSVDSSYDTPCEGEPKATSGLVTVYNQYGVAYAHTQRNIAHNDWCTIHEVYTSGYCKVTYPISGGTHTEYARVEDFDIKKSNAPILCVDVARGEAGKIVISGWAYDKDNPSKSLDIHVYIDDNEWVGGTVCQYEDDDGLKKIIGPASSYLHR